MEINISVLETRYIKINVFSGLGDHILVSRAPEFQRKLAQTCARFCSVLRALLNCILNYFFLLILEILVNEAGRVAYNFISSAREPRPGQPVCPARGFPVIAAKLCTGDQILVSSSASLASLRRNSGARETNMWSPRPENTLILIYVVSKTDILVSLTVSE